MVTQAHRWPVNPEVIDVHDHTGLGLCVERACPERAKYNVAFPKQRPTLYCQPHALTSIGRTVGRDGVDLGRMTKDTNERGNRRLRRGWYNIHWPKDGLACR